MDLLVSVFSGMKIMSNVIIDPYIDTASLNKLRNPFTLSLCKNFHMHSLLQEKLFYLIRRLLKANVKQNPIYFIFIKLMDSFMKDYNPFQIVSAWHKVRLSRSSYILCNSHNSINAYFCKNHEAKTYWSIC